jgi:type IX secretion system PorP/SprF family membrane protein
MPAKKPVQNILAGILATVFILTATCCKAQLNPYQATYYHNRYLNNPAMAGLEKGLNLNLIYLQQWTTFPGAPKSQSFTTDYQAAKKVGLGLNINDNQSGIFRQTRVMGTYAYHLPLGDRNQKLNFGVSLGFNDSRVNYNDINGDITDQELAIYNQAKPYIDCDLGVSYTSNNLFIEGVLPNLKSTFFNSSVQKVDADRTVLFAAISYKINLSGETRAFSLEPLAAYRKIKESANVFDAGLNFKMNDYHLDLQTIYHSNNNFGLGVAFDQESYAINFDYNLATGQIGNYTSGGFEVGIKLKLFNK